MSNGSDASSSLLGFLIATFVFTVSFATVIQVSVDRRSDGRPMEEVTNYSVVAASLADLLLASPGRGWYSADACTVPGVIDPALFAPDAVASGRFGLAEERCASGAERRQGVSNLSFDKLENLFQASMASNAANDAVDYYEARRSLGLDTANLDFHLRAWPTLPDTSRKLMDGYKDKNLRPLYIGDYEEVRAGQQGDPVVQHAAGFVDGPTATTLYVNITNNGTTTTAFSVVFKVPTDKEIVAEHHSGLLAPGADGNVTFIVNKTSDWMWKSGRNDFEYIIRDPSKTVGQGTVSMSGVSMTAGSVKRILNVESTQLEWRRQSGSVTTRISYDALDGDGDSNINYNGWSLEILNATGAVVATDGSLQNNGGTEQFTISETGAYEVLLYGGSGWVAQRDRFHVVDAGLPTFAPSSVPPEWVPQTPTPLEAAYVDAVIENFDLGVRDVEFAHPSLGHLAEGDVLPDDNGALADWLPGLLLDGASAGTTAKYSVVFVGSQVDHNTLTSGSVKLTIEKWVLAGGTLIVFGSDSQAVQWLEPLFHAGIDTAGNGISVPDQDHPILVTPNRLDTVGLDSHGTDWHFNSGAGDLFTHVVVSSDQDDILAVSNPGAFGAGRVVLTSWQPHDPTPGSPPSDCNLPPAATCPGLQMIDNFVTLAYRTLFLDYGPRIPTNAVQGVQSRIVVVYHPELDDLVTVHFLIFVFK